MAFIDIGLTQPAGPILEKGPVLLRTAQFDDYWPGRFFENKAAPI